MQFVDTHCHIDLYDNPLEELGHAEAAQVGVLAVTNAPFVFTACRDLVAGRQDVWAAVGLHPELVGQYGHQVDELVEHLGETRFVGEVGLDYRVTDPSTHEAQRGVFGRIIEACDQREDAVMTIHSRGAEADVVSMIGELSKGTTILHWYSGAVKYLDIAQGLGSYFSVNSAMLASKNGRKLVSRMDRSRVLTESDGPFAIVRRRRACPRDIPWAIHGLADFWGEEPEAVRAVVMDNWAAVLKF